MAKHDGSGCAYGNILCCYAETDRAHARDETSEKAPEQHGTNLPTQQNADPEHVVLNMQYGERDQHPAQPHQHQSLTGNQQQHQHAPESRSAQHLKKVPPGDEQQPAVAGTEPQQVMQQSEQTPRSEQQQQHQTARGEGERVQLHDSADSREGVQQQQLPRSLNHAHGSRSGRQEVGLA